MDVDSDGFIQYKEFIRKLGKNKVKNSYLSIYNNAHSFLNLQVKLNDEGKLEYTKNEEV